MKKIVKCILPIISSAALAAPVLVGCGKSTIIPDSYYEIVPNQTLVGLKDDCPSLEQYNTLKIPKLASLIAVNAFVNDQRLSSIKYLDLRGESLWAVSPLSFQGFPNLQKIFFPKDVIFDNSMPVFINLPSLTEMDMTCYDTEPQSLLRQGAFSGTIGPGSGTIYVKNEKVQQYFITYIASSEPLTGWTVEIKK